MRKTSGMTGNPWLAWARIIGCVACAALAGCYNYFNMPVGWNCDSQKKPCDAGWSCLGGPELDARAVPANPVPSCYRQCAGATAAGAAACGDQEACLGNVCVPFDRACASQACPIGFICDATKTCVKALDDGQACGSHAVCRSKVCQGTCQAPTCNDGVQNGVETSVDCGGGSAGCAPCGTDATCVNADDCASKHCDGSPKVCVAATCNDDIANGDEGDVDCGQSCPDKCLVNMRCNVPDDCGDGVCTASGRCAAPACTDSVKNGGEIDADCAGPCAARCGDGKTCQADSDCANKICRAERGAVCGGTGCTCQPARCDDGVQNGAESDVDCGLACGPQKACADGRHCAASADCISNVCGGGACLAQSCGDNVKNGHETDKDCGGPDCAPCVVGKECVLSSDCATRICTAEPIVGCSAPTCCQENGCTNGTKSPGESDVDCGGPACARCAAGKACLVSTDCASGLCLAGGCAVQRIAGGVTHKCAITAAGAVKCWGAGLNGKLGYASTANLGDDETLANVGLVNVGAGVEIVQVTAGFAHTCALASSGEVMCWGLGKNGRLGYGSGANVGDDEDPAAAGFVNLGAGMKAVQVAAGYGHNCVLTDAGEVKCWGQGASGRLGYGATVDVGLNEVPANVGFVPLGRNLRAVQVALGLSQTCVVTNDGTVKCWGANGGGELGIGNTNDVGDDETPAEAPCVNLGAGVKVAQISLGVGHACVLTTAGAVKCWGNAAAGQLGYGNTNNVGSAVIPANVGFVELGVSTTVTQVGAGDEYTCARTSDGKVKCWGSGEAGRLGYQSITNIGDDELPSTAGFVDIGTATTAQQLAVGNKSNCAVIAAGQAVCWGYGLSGQLGHGNTNDIGDDETPGSVGPIVFDE